MGLLRDYRLLARYAFHKDTGVAYTHFRLSDESLFGRAVNEFYVWISFPFVLLGQVIEKLTGVREEIGFSPKDLTIQKYLEQWEEGWKRKGS